MRVMSDVGFRDDQQNITLGLKLGYEHQKEVFCDPGEGLATNRGRNGLLL
jgi:hypothetical protein